ILVSGIPAGVSHTAVLPQVTVTDPHLSGVTLKLDNAAYTQGVPITANGGHVFIVTANDTAGNIAVSSSAFTLNLPPVAPGNPAFSAVEGLGATLSCESTAQDLAGYRVYKDGALRSQGLLTALQYQDPDFAAGTAHVYEVSAMDTTGQEGTRARLEIPAVNFSLDSYGVLENGVPALMRGFFDVVRLRLENMGTGSAALGPAAVELISSTITVFSRQVPSVSVPAGGSSLMTTVVAVPSDIADAPVFKVSLQLPSGLGTTAAITKTFTLAARSPVGPAVELFAGPMIYGTNAQVQVKFNNKGSAPLEIRTAVISDVAVTLATPQGTLLSQATLS
ncbi:MAG: hypothetical protein AABY92_09830, partial [Thermodesulfobacteriota bacterium]